MKNKHPFSPLLTLTMAMSLIPAAILFSSCARKFMVVKNPPSQPHARILEKPPRVALVLGGGAFHGAAHVGVIKVLEEEKIPIDLIIGTSAGSLVGAMYADNPHIDSLIPLVNDIRVKDVFDFSLLRSSEGDISGKRLQEFLDRHLHVKNIEETVIPFVAIATDINAGKSVALAAGPIAPSVNASCAVPYIFEPVRMYGTLFSDGGILNNIATDMAKPYDPLVIIAVDVMAAWDTAPDLKNKTMVLYRAFSIASNRLKSGNLRYADVVIAPDLTGMPYMSSKDNEKMMEAGIKAAKEAIPRILKILVEKGVTR